VGRTATGFIHEMSGFVDNVESQLPPRLESLWVMAVQPVIMDCELEINFDSLGAADKRVRHC
jgi:hypothetical protein